MSIVVICVIIAFIAVALVVVWLHQRERRDDPLLLKEILDQADALERELREFRMRLREISALAMTVTVSQEPRDLPSAEMLVQDALRDLLAHRLWLKAHVSTATRRELESARDALAGTREALARQLALLVAARVDLAATIRSIPSSAGQP